MLVLENIKSPSFAKSVKGIKLLECREQFQKSTF